MKKINHGLARGYKLPNTQDKERHSYKVRPVLGSFYFIPISRLAIESGNLPDYLPFVVVRVTPNIIGLAKGTRKHGVHYQDVDTWSFEHYAISLPDDDINNFVNDFYDISISCI